MTRKTTLLAAVLMACGVAAETAKSQTYHVVDFGGLGGFGDAEAFAIGSNGLTLVGFATASSQNHLGFFGGAHVLTPLSPLAGDTQSCAFGIDGAGRVFGVSYRLGFPDVHAVRVGSGGVSVLGNFTPRGVNAQGDAVGFLSRTDASGLRVERACILTDGDTTPTELPPIPGNMNCTAYAINSLRAVAGASGFSEGAATRPMVWVNGVGNDLGTLGGPDGAAYAINDAGVAVGYSTTAGAAPLAHATKFVLGPTGAVQSRTDLGTLNGPAGVTPTSYAFGVNYTGEVVGQSTGRAFVVLPARGMLELNALIPATPGFYITTARAIDNQGRIAATGVDTYGRPRPVLLVRCDADFDRSGRVNIDDIFIFINAWFAGTLNTDADYNGVVNIDDVFIFINIWFHSALTCG